MGRWVYRKPEPSHVRGLCVRCGINQQKGTSKGTFTSLCQPCQKHLYRSEQGKLHDVQYKRSTESRRKRPYRKYVGNKCERCGFVPEDLCQLDVDHIDEDHNNNEPSNLQTLCANCHRLKTKKARRE